MQRDQNEYPEIYRLDMRDEWINGAYDEEGNEAQCDICGSILKWTAERRAWICPDCGQQMERADYFNHIGAFPPGMECLTNCSENYPICKRYCERFPIDPNDPMLT